VIDQEMLNLLIYQSTKKSQFSIRNKQTKRKHSKREEDLQGGIKSSYTFFFLLEEKDDLYRNGNSIIHLHHRWILIYLNQAIILQEMEDLLEHSAKKMRRKKMRSSGKIELTNSINELAPKSNRSSLVNFGNVTGNNRIRVARISKIFNSVKLKAKEK